MHPQQTFRTIIVGSDGTASGRDALALGSVLGTLDHADLMAVGVYLDPMLPFPRHSELRGACEASLREDRDAIAPEARLHCVAAASPAAALAHAVAREQADLLVLGSDHRAEVGSVRAGGHAQQLLHGGPCAIAIAPRGYAAAAAPPRRIVAGYDGSEEAAAAVAHALRLGATAGASVRIVTAVDPIPPSCGGYDAMVCIPNEWAELAEIARTQARTELDELLTDAGDVASEVLDGEPGTALCAASRDADLLVIGSRHWGPFAQLFVGSAARYVVRHAGCPVLVLPRRAGAFAGACSDVGPPPRLAVPVTATRS
jgi:nucleotide-binding universal stress UspA family protein